MGRLTIATRTFVSNVDPTPAAPRAAQPFGYAFDGVRFELGRGRLLIDGVDAAAGPLVLNLLAVLCRSPGLLVLRQQLFDALWPRQTVSDDALTKLIGRLRETLGPYGHAVVTLRGRGVRLDASVVEIEAPVDAASLPSQSRLAVPLQDAVNEATVRPLDAQTETPARPAWRLWLAMGALLFVVSLALWMASNDGSRSAFDSDMLLPSDPAATVFSGFAITMEDLDTAQPGTADLLREASNAVDHGDVARGMVLLRVAHDSDPTTPVPGALLAYFQARKLQPVDPGLQAEVATRLGAATTPYVRLLAQLSADVETRGDGGTPTMVAMVAMRPGAWRLQLRIAHQAMGLRRHGPALAALQRIPDHGIPADLIMTALADRAALGDAEAVAEALDRGALTAAPAEYGLALRGRLAWTAGRVEAAIALMDEAAAQAVLSNNVRGELSARISAATFAFYRRQMDADSRLLQAATLIRRNTTLEAQLPEVLAMRAQLALDQGDRQAAESLLESAASLYLSTDFRLWLEVYNARLGLILPAGRFLGDLDRRTLDQLGHASAYQLADAWTAQTAGDLTAARTLLAAARSSGVDDTYLREDAAALEAVINGTHSTCRPDPPYPNLLRFSTCRIEAIPRDAWATGSN
ncbi:hypothetical protein C7S18_19660 [Ahniella affigens]|uniref:OmpR/PhoB-type domain-containing protein n=1 Tax=Ahniella affigens TaxID=2021234 RepID=A0A2P1PWM2_9GAMM|nr:winged helix-turn-helix domain-containing protein [Ahniella affigens]AVP99243.1 hypothetical protein C7S18_19660 [Ahniella affigens]